jgi:hypothetical protein
MTKLAGILSIAAACIGSGCAQTGAGPTLAQSSGRQCFLARDVNSFGAVSDQVIDVSVGASRYFRLQLAGGCPTIDWSRRLALRTTTGTSWICEGLDAEIFSLDGPFPQRCLVESVSPISKQQYLATRHR